MPGDAGWAAVPAGDATGADPEAVASAGPPAGWPLVVAIVGPTASGKSAVAMEVAERIGAEIVNADAYQLYRGMDVGTAKPDPADQARVPHHLLDVLDVTEEVSVARYQQWGRHVLAELARRKVPAVVVGGSGLYVRALVDDLRFPGSDAGIRAQWESELARLGSRALHRILADRDPAAAAHILPSNGRRIVRALEVGELTGRPFSAVLPPGGPALVPHLSIGLAWDRRQLDLRIQTRVHRMIEAGLEQEVRILLDRGLGQGPTASRALGYPQMAAVVHGEQTIEDAVASIVTATRRYARRQERWFRRDPRTLWLDGAAAPSSTGSGIAARLQRAPSSLAT